MKEQEGIYDDWPFEKYRKHPATNQTWLKTALGTTPKKADWQRRQPSKTEEHHTHGHLFEALVQFPETVERDYIVVPGQKLSTTDERKRALAVLLETYPDLLLEEYFPAKKERVYTFVDKATTKAERLQILMALDIEYPGMRDSEFTKLADIQAAMLGRGIVLQDPADFTEINGVLYKKLKVNSYDDLYQIVFDQTGKRVVTEYMMGSALAMVERCKELPVVSDILFNEHAEKQVTMVARLNGGLFRGRGDSVIPVSALSDYTRDRLSAYHVGFADPEAVVMNDIKTARDASPRATGFKKAASKYDYFFQVVFYALLYSKITGRTVIPMISAVEKPDPDMLNDVGKDAVEAVAFVIPDTLIPAIESRIDEAIRLHAEFVTSGECGYEEVQKLEPLSYYGG